LNATPSCFSPRLPRRSLTRGEKGDILLFQGKKGTGKKGTCYFFRGNSGDWHFRPPVNGRREA
jgi:hypothetical protein